jgi:hypothetical protein
MSATTFLILAKSIMFLCLGFTLISVPIVIDYQLTALRNDAKIQLNAIRTDTTALVNKRADSLQSFATDLFDKTNVRVSSIEKNAFKLAGTEVGNLNATLASQLGVLNTNVNTQLGTFNTNMNSQETTLNSSISDLTDAYKVIPQEVSLRFNKQTDCEHNGLCWQNLATDVMTNFRFTGRDLSEASKTFNNGFPVLMTGFNQSVTNFAGITDNFKKLTQPHWYDRVLGIAVNGSLIYSRLSPASIPIAIVQSISSKK